MRKPDPKGLISLPSAAGVGGVSDGTLCPLHALRRDRARALDYLEKAYATDSQWLGWLKNDKTFDPLRSEPRFAALMKKLRFEK